MELTCLSKGSGFHFPPCHILNVSGLTVLIDCPLDLSALKIFAPLPTHHGPAPHKGTSQVSGVDSLDSGLEARKRTKVAESLDGQGLIFAEPWYKGAKNLHLWDPCLIDIVLISSTMGILGLPFLTRIKGFSAKIYVTAATARFGKLMMEDLVSMHTEFRQFYGSEESGSPQWMKWENLELLPSALREVVLGEDGVELGGWLPLYSAADVKDCLQKVQTLGYAEEACYNGILVMKAFSSGSEIGSCNWTINGPAGNIAYISCSAVASIDAMEFDYHVLEGIDLVLFSNFLSHDLAEDVERDGEYPISATNDLVTVRNENVKLKELNRHLLSDGEISLSEGREKLAFIWSCFVDSVKAGGSVLIPLCRLGTLMQLLEHISDSFDTTALKVPIYFLSSVAEELLEVATVMPEWLCKQHQEKMFAGEPLFSYIKLIKEQKLHALPAVHSRKLLTNWQEPCIIFCPHWSLRLGPVVHLLRLWHDDPKSLLVLEDGLDADMALLPFKPIKMTVLKCSFSSGMRSQNVELLLRHFQPRNVLIPDELRQKSGFPMFDSPSLSVTCYAEGETLNLPSSKENLDVEIAADMVTQLNWRKLKQDAMDITRLEGELLVDHGKHQLLSRDTTTDFSHAMPSLFWGSPDMDKLLAVLSSMGINGSLEMGIRDHKEECANIVHIREPDEAWIRFEGTSTTISSPNANLATSIYEAVASLLDGI